MHDDKPSRIRMARITKTANGTTQYEGDPEAIAEAKDAFKEAQEANALKRELWGAKISPNSMSRLCAYFPSLRNVPGTDPWDEKKLLEWACGGGPSHGELLAAKFVLSVWNPTLDWEKAARDEGFITDAAHRFARFDLFEAMGVWDPAHVSAMMTWISTPFWP